MTREKFKKIFSEMLLELDFKKKGNSFFFENKEVLFVLALDKSSHSGLYYVRGGFFEKPLSKEVFGYKFFESEYRWYAKFPVYKKILFWKRFVNDVDSIDFLELSEKQLIKKVNTLRDQLVSLLEELNGFYLFINYISPKSIDEFENRKIYKVLTSEILNSIEDDKLVQAIVDNIYEIKDQGEYDSCSDAQKGIFAIYELDGQVNNGGLNQYYFNTNGDLSTQAALGYSLVGLEELAEITKTANDRWEKNKEKLSEYNDGSVESFSESYQEEIFNDLDERFYSFESVDTDRAQVKYIRENMELFV